jgi:hypothetical protein
MLASPAAIAAMALADRVASRVIYGSATARIVAGCSLRCERLASGCNRAETVLAPRLWHARIAML